MNHKICTPQCVILLVLFLSNSSTNHIICNVSRHVAITGDFSNCVLVNQSQWKRHHCGSLQTALELAARMKTAQRSCTLVEIGSGLHTLTQNVTVTNNVILRGSSSRDTRVNFNLDRDVLASKSLTEPIPVLSFQNTQIVSIENVIFDGSPGFIDIQSIGELYVNGSTFRYFIQGALNVYNFHKISVTDCVFEHNGPASFLTFNNFRGHCGGISISQFKYKSSYSTHTATIRHTVFRNNSAMPEAAVRITRTLVYKKRAFTGRGGALGIYIGDTTTTTEVKVINCLFEKNVASKYGGAVYIILSFKSIHSVTFENCYFKQNKCPDAGAAFIGIFGPDSLARHNRVVMLNTTFSENSADLGGGIVINMPKYDGKETYSNAAFENCSFVSNTARDFGGAVALFTPDHTRLSAKSRPMTFTNCKFVNNSSPTSATIAVVFFHISFFGYNVFDGNVGSAIQISGSLVGIHGHLEFLNHRTSGSPDGVLSVTSFGQILVHRGTQVKFINNTGVNGAAISAGAWNVPTIYSQLSFNPFCFLQFEDPRLPPDEWEDVQFYFSGNSAVEGSIADISNFLKLCSWVKNSEPLFNASKVFKWDFIEFGENKNSFYPNESTDPQFYIASNAEKLHIQNKTINLYPGKKIGLSVTLLNELHKSVGGKIRFEDSNSSTNTLVLFKPAALIYNREDDLLTTRLLISNTSDIHNVTHVATATALFESRLVYDTLTINIKTCPPGYALMAELTVNTAGQRASTCQCNSANNLAIVTCDKEMTFLVLRKPSWTESNKLYICRDG